MQISHIISTNKDVQYRATRTAQEIVIGCIQSLRMIFCRQSHHKLSLSYCSRINILSDLFRLHFDLLIQRDPPFKKPLFKMSLNHFLTQRDISCVSGASFS